MSYISLQTAPDLKNRLRKIIVDLLKNKKIDYSNFSKYEILGLVFGLSIHRRQIKTEAVNQLLKEANKYYSLINDDIVKKIGLEVDQLLEEFDFNFKDSEISLEYSDDLVKKLLKETKSLRLNHERIRSKISSLARQVVKDLSVHLGFSPVDEDEIQSRLYEYLIDYGEKTYDPGKSAYTTFAIMILQYRAKYLFREYMSFYSQTQLIDFNYRITEREQESNTSEKWKADYDSEDVDSLDAYMASEIDPSFEELTFYQAREIVIRSLTALEKAILYSEEVLRVPVSAWPFFNEERDSSKKISKKLSDYTQKINY